MPKTPFLILVIGVVVALFSAAVVNSGLSSGEKPEWGLYQIYWGRSYDSVLGKELEKFSSNPDYVMFYRDLDRPFPKSPVDTVRNAGSIPVVSLELWHWHSPQRKSLTGLASGEYDEFLRRWARAARKDGRRLLLRFGFEFNGDWFSWSLDPKTYVTAWRRAYAIFQAEKATQVEWVWSPNVVSVPASPGNDMHLYYPGDEYVDWVAVDGYNFGDHHDEWHQWQSFEEIFAEVVRDFEKRYAGKPIMIAETGCAPDENVKRARWYRDAYRWVTTRSTVKAVIWFNFDKRKEQEPNWRIDATPGSLKAFNETFAR